VIEVGEVDEEDPVFTDKKSSHKKTTRAKEVTDEGISQLREFSQLLSGGIRITVKKSPAS